MATGLPDPVPRSLAALDPAELGTDFLEMTPKESHCVELKGQGAEGGGRFCLGESLVSLGADIWLCPFILCDVRQLHSLSELWSVPLWDGAGHEEYHLFKSLGPVPRPGGVCFLQSQGGPQVL